MFELLVVAAVAGIGMLAVARARRNALRRARLQAEGMLDELAAAACAALAGGEDPSSSRRAARAVERYSAMGDRVAAASTRRELEVLVARHRLRQGAYRAVTRGLERARETLAEAVPARR
jgi:hypothetical protein